MRLSSNILRLAAGVALSALAGMAMATGLQDLPHGAHAGECYSHTTTAPVYRTERKPIPQPPLVSWREIPAVYRTASRQVLVAPGRVDRQFIPAVMGTRVHWIEHPGADRIVEAPPVYRWEERRVVVRAAHLEWRPGHAAQGYGRGSNQGYGEGISVRPTGEVMCRVLVPAVYATKRVRVLVTPGKTCVVKGPSTRERIVEHFVVTPARTIEHPIAPIYRTVTERVLVSPARRDRVETPQPPRYVETRVMVSPGHPAWTRIACKVPVVPRYRPRPAPVPVPLPTPRPHGGQCHTHTVCEDAPYAQPRPTGYGEPAYHAPVQDQSYGAGDAR